VNKFSNNRTALMVFSLSAAQEARRKQVFGKHRQNLSKDFFQLLIDDTQRLAKDSGLDVIWFDEQKQRGTDFASRFSNAFQDLFDQGYERVISIGNDCPNLQIGHIQKSIQQLENNDLVLGPAQDGGVYLLGITKKAFDKNTFAQLPWQQNNLYQTIKIWGKQARFQSISFELQRDLDTSEDAVFYAQKNPKCFLALFIAEILHGFSRKFITQKEHFQLQFFRAHLPSRAPPIFCFSA